MTDSDDRLELLEAVVTPEQELRLLVKNLQQQVGAAEPRTVARDVNLAVREVCSRRRSTSPLRAR